MFSFNQSVRNFLSAVAAIAWKDLRAEFRSRQLVSAMALFALLTVLIFYFTLDGQRAAQIAALPAIVWAIIVFAGTLGLSRSLSAEHDSGSLDALLLAPIPRPALFYGKLIGIWLFELVTAAVAAAALSVLFNANLLVPALWVVFVVGTIGFAAIGTLLGSMAVYATGRETTLPILIMPVALPVIIAAVNATTSILADRAPEDWLPWLAVLASLDAIFLALAFVLFDVIVEE
ncbi:MAG: heme exporter protein CcmB [Aggregatilineales bacterium]